MEESEVRRTQATPSGEERWPLRATSHLRGRLPACHFLAWTLLKPPDG